MLPMTRVFNFSAGPAILPEPVLRQAADEMLDWHGSGMSVMEMSHRGKEFMGIHAETEALLRELLGIPSNYKVLFMQGGAIGENAIVPMNLIGRTGRADYVDTGDWSKRSLTEARTYGEVQRGGQRRGEPLHRDPEAVGTGSSTRMRPTCTSARTRPSAACEYHWTPDTGQRAAGGRHVVQHPVAADRRQPLRPDLRGRAEEHGAVGRHGGDRARRPARATRCRSRRRPSTTSCRPRTTRCTTRRPPTRSTSRGWCCKHIKAQGGLAAMEEHNRAKAKLLYDFLDGSSFFRNEVARDDRSLMNVPVQAARRVAQRRIPAGRAGARHGPAEGPPHRWAACGRRSTTRCPSRACRRWWPTCRISSASTADRIGAGRVAGPALARHRSCGGGTMFVAGPTRRTR